jgi:hypothetical protein
MHTTVLSMPKASFTPGVRFGRRSALWSSVFSEVVLFKEKQMPVQSSHGKCHIPFWWQDGIRPFLGKATADYKQATQSGMESDRSHSNWLCRKWLWGLVVLVAWARAPKWGLGICFPSSVMELKCRRMGVIWGSAHLCLGCNASACDTLAGQCCSPVHIKLGSWHGLGYPSQEITVTGRKIKLVFLKNSPEGPA